MKKLLALFLFSSYLTAQVQLGKNVQIGSAPGGGGSVTPGTQVLPSYPTNDGTPIGTVNPSNISTDSTYSDVLALHGNVVGKKTNGTANSDLYQTGGGNNGITNAAASSDCTSGCDIAVPANSTSTETPGAYSGSMLLPGPMGTHLEDFRYGALIETWNTPISAAADAGVTGSFAGPHWEFINFARRVNPQTFPNYGFLNTTLNYMTGGNNLYNLGGPEYKSNYQNINLVGNFYTPGQHGGGANQSNCHAEGDCLVGWGRVGTASASSGDNSDEGAHPAPTSIEEPATAMVTSCTAGCTTGSTQVSLSGNPTQADIGDGRYLQDGNNVVYSSGCRILTAQQQGYPTATVTLTGTDCIANSSMFLATTPFVNGSTHPAGAYGAATVAITTSGQPTGFLTTTAGLPSSGVACISDIRNDALTASPGQYETSTYSVVDATHIAVTFTKPHPLNPILSIGGGCGQQLIPAANANGSIASIFTSGTVAQALTLLGSINNVLYLGDFAQVAAVYETGGISETEVYFLNQGITSITRSSNVTTVTMAADGITNGLTGVIAGVSDSTYNGTFTLTQTGTNTFTYPNTGSNGSSTGGTVTIDKTQYALVPAAKIRQVMNSTTGTIDLANIQLYPNTVAFVSGDALSVPHGSELSINGDGDYNHIGQITPHADYFNTNYGNGAIGAILDGRAGPSQTGMHVSNMADPRIYLGLGGTKNAPNSGVSVSGPFQWDITADAGIGDHNLGGFARIYCKPVIGCNSWNSGYSVFEFQTANASDFLNYNPVTGTLELTGLSHVTDFKASHINGNLGFYASGNGSYCLGASPNTGACLGYSGNGSYNGTFQGTGSSAIGTAIPWTALWHIAPSDGGFGWTNTLSTAPFTTVTDTAFTRISQDVVGLGNPQSGGVSGTPIDGELRLKTLTVGTSGTIGGSLICTQSGANCPAGASVFGPSGSGHSTGIVPDPGATAGTTRYLREDATWDTPPGSGGGISGLTTGIFPIATSSTTVGNSLFDYGVTTASIFTFGAPISAPSFISTDTTHNSSIDGKQAAGGSDVLPTQVANHGYLVDLLATGWNVALGTGALQPLLPSENVISFSATPTLSGVNGVENYMVLTGAVTSSTLANGAYGGVKMSLLLCQDATGGRTFVPPGNLTGFMSISTSASSCSAQDYVWSVARTKWTALTPGVVNQ